MIASSRTAEQDDMVIAEVRISAILASSLEAALPVKFVEIVEATAADQVLPVVMDYVKSGWPSDPRRITNQPAMAFHRIQESLGIINGALTFMDRVVVPLSLQSRVLSQLHRAHPGVNRMKMLARAYVYWPGINEDITRLVSACSPCQSVAKFPVKTNLASWPLAKEPWERVHVDFAGPVDSCTYFIMVDAFSKWPEVFIMTSTTSQSTIKILREVCSRFGNMKTLVSDNGPQFTSKEFASFCEGENIRHIKTPPFHPQSNGQVERFVDTLKRTLGKLRNNSDHLQQFLQQYRATPHLSAPDNKSPAELMLGRKIRLPLDAVLPQLGQEKRLINNQMEEEFNRKHGTRARDFYPKQSVLLRLSAQHPWTSAEVVERIGRVMCNVLCDGRLIRVHINQLRPDNTIRSDVLEPTVVSTRPAARVNPRQVTRAEPPVLRPRPVKRGNKI